MFNRGSQKQILQLLAVGVFLCCVTTTGNSFFVNTSTDKMQREDINVDVEYSYETGN